MKPLTIEELKALKVGDWVWIVISDRSCTLSPSCYYQVDHLGRNKEYFMFCYGGKRDGLRFSVYGTKWVAYKNKEQAEAKGEIIELPCNVGTPCCIVKNGQMKVLPITSYKVVDGNAVYVYFAQQKTYNLGYRPDTPADRDISMLGLFNDVWFENATLARAKLAELKGEPQE